MSEGYRFIGKTIPRQDAVKIVTGTARFLDDIALPNMLYGQVKRSPHAHAWIRKINKSKVEKMRGVRAIVTWQEVPDWKGGVANTTRILDRRVRFVGDVVALVAADSKEIAREAAKLVEVDYDVLPAVYNIDEATAPGAPQLYDECPGNVMISGYPSWGSNCLTDVVMGDVEKGFTEADITTEGTFCYENIPNPMPPECPGAIGLWEEPNRMTIWVSNQAFYRDIKTLQKIVGKNIEIRTFGGPCGGSYGSKIMSWQVQLYAVLLSRATGRPVKLCFSKEEHLAAFVVRPSCRMTAKIGIKKDGTVTAVSGTWLLDTGYYSRTTQLQVAVGCGEVQMAVRCPNWDLKTAIVCTNRNASGIVRGFGGQELKCCLIPLLSLAMEKASLDPVEFFKKNFVRAGDGYFWRNGVWYTYRGIDHTSAIEEGAKRFNWEEKWKGWLQPTSVNGAKRRGVGIGIHGNADVGEDDSEAYVRLDSKGTATIFSALSEHGTGQKTNLARMAAEVLQLPMERIIHVPSDSAVSPHELGPGGSRMTYAAGSAVIAAAENARQKLFELAAPVLRAEPGELDTEDGMIFVKASVGKRIPWETILGGERTCMGYGLFKADYTLSNCVTTFVEVEVDTDTGKVDLLQVVNASDVGQIIDPPGLQGQLNGCLGSAGIDSALFEETVLDHSTGRILNANMIDYKWRTFAELPVIDNVVLETPFPSHRFHAIGVGEVATAPGPSAVLMAVSNAIGVWLHEYPVTPEKVLKALHKIPARIRKEGRQ